MRRIFGKMEAIFDILYLAAAGTIGSLLLFSADLSFPRLLAGAAAIFLTAGDAFHLLPRIHGAFTGKEEELKRALGRGKKIASLTMTIFYLILWHIGLLLYEPRRLLLLTFGVWMLAGLRTLLCLSFRNEWEERYTSATWGIYRNIPFALQGFSVAGLYFFNRASTAGLDLMWLAILLSFAFYLPVVLWSNRYPKIGMLMLPKTCTYLWMLVMLLAL